MPRRSDAPRRLGAWLCLAVGAAVAALAACADWEAPETATFGLPDVAVAQPSFARDVQPIFSKRCALGGCHTSASQQGLLILEAGSSYDQIVNHFSTAIPGLPPRVTPGNHAASWLWQRIQPDPSLRHDFPRMPLAAVPLSDNQIATITNWIDQGAQRN